MENDDKKQDTSKAVKVCLAYEEMMRDMVQQDFKEISELIYQAKRIFVYGTGMVQRSLQRNLNDYFILQISVFMILVEWQNMKR